MEKSQTYSRLMVMNAMVESVKIHLKQIPFKTTQPRLLGRNRNQHLPLRVLSNMAEIYPW